MVVRLSILDFVAGDLDVFVDAPQPGVTQDLLQPDPIVRSDFQTAPDEALALLGDAPPEVELGVADLLVLLEWDVPADHVVEEDAQGPDGGRHPVVPRAPDPLRRGVDSRPVKVLVGLRCQEAPEPKSIR